LERKGTFRGVPVFDDYAHHPTELKVTLETLRQIFPHRRIVCVFQPHTYTRTQHFYREFARALLDADVAILTTVYPAREQPIPGVNSRLICEEAQQLGHRAVECGENFDHVIALLEQILTPNDIVVTIGAGSVWQIAERLTQLDSTGK